MRRQLAGPSGNRSATDHVVVVMGVALWAGPRSDKRGTRQRQPEGGDNAITPHECPTIAPSIDTNTIAQIKFEPINIELICR